MTLHNGRSGKVVSALQYFDLDDLRTIMRQVTGEDQGFDPAGDIAGRSYSELGYDSLAVLELCARIGQLVGASIPDGVLDTESTPTRTVQLVNELSAAPVGTWGRR